MPKSKEDSFSYVFVDPEEFNKKTDFICKDAFGEYQKFAKFFEANLAANGKDSFAPTMAVFSLPERLVGLVTCRSANDKEDLYKALAEMMYFPLSISSSLFIIAQDAQITLAPTDESSEGEPSDGLVISYVTPQNCLIYTCPYTIDDNMNVNWNLSQSYVTNIASDLANENIVGEMLELYYVFSHANTTGPFSTNEILRYFDNAGFHYEIFNSQYISDKKNSIVIPF